MRLLLDTHAFVWWLQDANALSPGTRASVAAPDSAVFISAASAWEITTKHRIGKWPAVASIAADVLVAIQDNGFEPLAVTVAHAQRAGALPGAHKDPFDRLLAAQALSEGLTLVTRDALFDGFGVARIW